MRYLGWLVFFLVAMAVTGCDHTTKLMAASALPAGEKISLISGVLSLEQTRNFDSAFSLLSGFVPKVERLALLKTTATLGTLFVAFVSLARFGRASHIERLALACLLGGAAGNAIDRWRWGYVVDFIHVEHWPVFNVADIALTLGGGLLFLSAWLATRVENKGIPVHVHCRTSTPRRPRE